MFLILALSVNIFALRWIQKERDGFGLSTTPFLLVLGIRCTRNDGCIWRKQERIIAWHGAPGRRGLEMDMERREVLDGWLEEKEGQVLEILC